MRYRALPALLSLLIALSSQVAAAQPPPVRASRVAPFLGTWDITMTDPPEMKGAKQSIRVWDDNGAVAASVQIGRFPALRASGVFMDGDMLVVTLSHAAPRQMMENGQAIWAVFALSLDGDSLRTAQMMERSATNKRGVGRKEN